MDARDLHGGPGGRGRRRRQRPGRCADDGARRAGSRGTVELALGFAEAFGPAGQLTQAAALEVAVGDGPPTQLPIPFAAPRALQAGATRLVAFAGIA